MNNLSIFTLKALRKLYFKTFRIEQSKPECEEDPDVSSQIIYCALTDDKPCMIARFGANELLCIINYLGVKANNRNVFSYITGKSNEWWWNDTNLKNMYFMAGFFPPKIQKIEKFCELMLNDITEVDILGSWMFKESNFETTLGIHKKITLELLNPYFSKIPWTKALEGKRVLVVHPFAKTIMSQYKKRELLFSNNLLPAFELKVIKAVQSIAGVKTNFADWFEALEYMKKEVDKVDYDICLIGCGAYGFPLAAHIKRKGKKAIHLGGSLQLLFGISGKRWENESYNVKFNYSKLINQYWVKATEDEKPENAQIVESACYW